MTKNDDVLEKKKKNNKCKCWLIVQKTRISSEQFLCFFSLSPSLLLSVVSRFPSCHVLAAPVLSRFHQCIRRRAGTAITEERKEGKTTEKQDTPAPASLATHKLFEKSLEDGWGQRCDRTRREEEEKQSLSRNTTTSELDLLHFWTLTLFMEKTSVGWRKRVSSYCHVRDNHVWWHVRQPENRSDKCESCYCLALSSPCTARMTGRHNMREQIHIGKKKEAH